jgi:hypothetical protein
MCFAKLGHQKAFTEIGHAQRASRAKYDATIRQHLGQIRAHQNEIKDVATKEELLKQS